MLLGLLVSFILVDSVPKTDLLSLDFVGEVVLGSRAARGLVGEGRGDDIDNEELDDC